MGRSHIMRPTNVSGETNCSKLCPTGSSTRSGLYCTVDASWKSPADKAGIGWSLYSKEGILRLQGSSAIEATTSPLVAEAMAILLAVQQLNCTGYNNVAVLGDSLQLFKCLNHTETDVGKRDAIFNEATPIVADILALSHLNRFCFQWVPRNVVQYADHLANRARCSMQEYIVTWLQT